jgi:hypothetical protein
LSREQRRTAGVCDAATQVKVVDERERGEAGPSDSGRGAGESRKEGPGGDGAPTGGLGQHSVGAAAQMRFKTNSEFKCFKQISICFEP